MNLKLVLIILQVTTIVHGRPLQDYIAVNHGCNKNYASTDYMTVVVYSLVSGINVLLSWISFLIPPSKMKERLTVLMTTLIVKMSIINAVFNQAAIGEVILVSFMDFSVMEVENMKSMYIVSPIIYKLSLIFLAFSRCNSTY